MKNNAKKFTPEAMTLATGLAKRRVQNTIDLAQSLAADAGRERRLADQRCAACYYFPRVAGQAFTDQPCACCGIEQTYSSTDTDALCITCAVVHDLCKHCGGDLNMDSTRSHWPEASTPQQP